ncbi:orotidine-5'-phosphate decarboxylase [Paludibaculum fermentans]|uniref:Orotidine 5'-phosphate decarboxylase n=1 Tax=Paludibaculum fermentans TaxID=1473598 RepID=A0A7S7NS56_PALFE|nr:orotidine-5'-phosphate decarboxylase [Paludibaculum fermentans]QOY88259.1 orotidine-5'-phosphate decarboxylase [Paludibaculum fermentans]
MNYNPIIVALDVPDAGEALSLVDRLATTVDFYKVGLELFTAEGPAVVREIIARRKQVFVDLKMYDIHETVKRAAARVAALGGSLLTVHSSPQVIRAAREAAAGTNLRILAVTVLTSFDQADLEDVGITGRTVAQQVEWLAAKAVDAGADGLVCSPLEVERLRSLIPRETLLVVPGVRSAGADHGDQKRVATPTSAMEAGASYLVVGREITRAAEPAAAADAILRALGTQLH